MSIRRYAWLVLPGVRTDAAVLKSNMYAYEFQGTRVSVIHRSRRSNWERGEGNRGKVPTYC